MTNERKESDSENTTKKGRLNMTHITKKNLVLQPFVLNDISVVELLIEYRYKYDDNLFLSGESSFVSGAKALNQEVVATYASLDRLIKLCGFSEQQLLLIKMTEQGYTHREIGQAVGIEFQNVKKALKTIYKAIVKENERQWRRVVYISTLGLKTKQCSKCKEHLPATNEFYSDNKSAKDGLHSICKKCR
ncbi:hypothetical protein [Lysinibacillus sphaericus]|uniref:hypothetical protein n=1 Tax=Lysinibacillus sphaericus TaxID=1421 RepID=UPI001CBF0220|nr:hypothetical protein [Lysinibacillus sphaericus]